MYKDRNKLNNRLHVCYIITCERIRMFFGPPGSGSGTVINLNGSGSTVDPDPSINNQKARPKIGYGSGSVVRIRGSGSAPKCHGSTTIIISTFHWQAVPRKSIKGKERNQVKKPMLMSTLLETAPYTTVAS